MKKHIHIVKILLLSFMVVGLTQYVFSAPASGDTPLTYGDVADIIDFATKPQSKDCSGGTGTSNVLTKVTLSLCHNSRPTQPTQAEYAFGVQGITSLGPITTQGKLFADLSQGIGVSASAARDALRLTTGKNNNITTIATNKDKVGVWSQFLNTWAQGRFGRLDAERLIITSKALDNTNSGGTVDPYRTTSYTSTIGGTIPHLDLAGTTNIGMGDYCYRTARDCDINTDNLFISGFGREYTTCRDFDPSATPHASLVMAVPGFTCTDTRVLPPSRQALMLLMPNYGFSYTGGSATFCVNNNYGSMVSNIGGTGKNIYIANDTDETFYFETKVFVDPYLEKPIPDGWHASNGFGVANDSDLNHNVSWFRTVNGAVIDIGQCSSSAPSGMFPDTTYGSGFYYYSL